MRGLLTTVVGATIATAIVIPPNAAPNQGESFKITLPNPKSTVHSFGVDPYTQLVRLPCPGCPIAHFGDGGISWIKGEENYLLLNISASADRNSLDLNGAQLYPPPEGLTQEPQVLQVPIELSTGDVRTIQRVAGPVHPLKVSSWSMHAGAVQKSKDDEEILKLHIQIEALEEFPVNIPEVQVTAIKTQQAGLLIVNAHASTNSREEELKQCHGWPMLCEWRQAIAARVQSLMSTIRMACHKLRVGAANIHKALRPQQHESSEPHVLHKKPHLAQQDQRKISHQVQQKKPHHKQKDQHKSHHHMQHKKPQHVQNKKPQHKKPQSQGEHHSAPTVHGAMHKVARIILTIIIPVLFGVLAGMITYLLGTIVGTGIAMLWRATRARSQHYSRIQLEDSDEEEGDAGAVYVKEGFIEQEVYPHYIVIEGAEILED